MVSVLLSHLVTEKEKKIKEGMRMMGMSDISLWLSWTITYAAFLLFATLVIIVLSMATQLFKPSNMFLIFLLLYLYALSIMAFAFMFVPFFDKAMTAAGFGSVSTILFSLLYMVVTRVNIPRGLKWVFCLLSPTAVAIGLDEVLACSFFPFSACLAFVACL